MTRKEMLQLLGVSAAAMLVGCGKSTPSTSNNAPGMKSSQSQTECDVVVLSEKSSDIKQRIVASLQPLGGIEAFVKPGAFVVLKPNAAWHRTPDIAANTNPDVLSSVIDLCKQAGAGRILITEHSCDSPAETAFEMSGISDAAKSANVELVAAMTDKYFTEITLPNAKALTRVQSMKALYEADCFINIPVAKVHSATKLSLGLKNLMGTVSAPQDWHRLGLMQCIADYASVVKPHLTIIDATRILLTRGPKGPGQTRDANSIIASCDPVAADSLAAELFNMKGSDLDYLVKAETAGVGVMDLSKIKVVRV